MNLEARRGYIQNEVGDAVIEMNRYLQEEGVEYTISEEDLGKLRFHFDSQPETDGNLFCEIEDNELVDHYLIGRNVGRILLRYLNSKLDQSDTEEAEKIRRVVYHLIAIAYVRTKQPDSDVEAFPETYPTARDPWTPFSLRETEREKMERLTGKNDLEIFSDEVDHDDEPPEFEEELKRFEQKSKSEKDNSSDSDSEPKNIEKDPDNDTLPKPVKGKPIIDISINSSRDVSPPTGDYFEMERERGRKKDEDNGRSEWDQNTDMDFGQTYDVGSLYSNDQEEQKIRKEIESVQFDDQAKLREARMSEEFRAARTIFLGRRDDTKNWRVVLEELLKSPEDHSIRYLKGITNF